MKEFLTALAKASGIGTPTRADLARIDRKRKKKGANDDWTHPHDPDAKITKMKDGRTHLAPVRGGELLMRVVLHLAKVSEIVARATLGNSDTRVDGSATAR